MKKGILKYSSVILFGAALFFISNMGGRLYENLRHSEEAATLETFFVMATLFVLSFVVFYVSHIIKLPSFVIAIIVGFLTKSMLSSISGNGEVLGIIVGLGATLILFSGGLEIPFKNFRKLIWKILSVSFIGLFLTAFMFSWSLKEVSFLFGGNISVLVAVLLGAVLASTDPAAIIPVLKKLRFHNRSVKDIIISESAVTDVVGTLLTIVFLTIALSGDFSDKINSWYLSVFSLESAIILAKQIVLGGAFGVVGYFFLELLLKVKHFFGEEFEADTAFFISVPIIIFTGALFLGGSGYLAAFVAGLIFHLTEHLNETERFFNNLVDGFLKPILFILLGSLVDLEKLWVYAPIGIVAALVFMFIIRPIAVFVSLGGFIFYGKEKLSFRDLLFISFVRETGAIPAVLMLTIVSLGIKDVDGLVEIGMWSILLTLIIEPLLTPAVAKFLHVAEIMQDKTKAKTTKSPAVMLVTRGESFIERFPLVLEWTALHKVEEVIIMLCLENKYTKDEEIRIKEKAQELFTQASKNEMANTNFSFISRKGLLHENINTISRANNNINAIFVGKKMLDYRLEELKQLRMPFYFLD